MIQYPLISTYSSNKNVTPVLSLPLNEVLNRIKNGFYADSVEKCRKAYFQDDKSEYERNKDKLQGFTVSGTFSPTRSSKNLDQYSKLLIFDVDKLTPDDLHRTKDRICENQFTFCCFISPSGHGLKFIVQVNTTPAQHKQVYDHIVKIYEDDLGITIDRSGSDISRLCYFSFDADLFINEQAAEYIYQEVMIDEPVQIGDEANAEDLYRSSVSITEKKYQFIKGSRTCFVYYLACNCNRYGILREDATLYIKQNFNFNEKRVNSAIHSAYKHHSNEFGKWSKPTHILGELPSLHQEDYLKNTPIISRSLFLRMPQILQKAVKVFIDERERDVFFTSALSILSGCLPGVKGVYAGQEVFPNLFSFIIAPPASGKGALKFAKMLGDVYHNHVLSLSREAERKHNIDANAYKQKIKRKKKSEYQNEEIPEKPPFRVVYIPANTSYAKMLFHLQDNDGHGIICETEADTLSNVFKQEWGSYSDMLRKAFHHERVSCSRKSNNEFIEVDAPALSIALSGTPGQVTGLIESAEDGLFSRFLFYAFRVDQRWKDVSPTANNMNLTEHFKEMSRQIFILVQFLQKEKTVVQLTNEQWQQLNQKCEKWLNDITMFTADEAASIVKRLGLILYRIAMLFTSLRKFENAEASVHVTCSDEDFIVAVGLAEIYLHHSILMFNNLPKSANQNQFKIGDNKRRFVDCLPDNFTRKEAVKIGKNHGLSESTVSHLLPKLVGSYFTQPKTGTYKKIK